MACFFYSSSLPFDSNFLTCTLAFLTYLRSIVLFGDQRKLHEHFADNENDPEMSRLNNLIHYHELIDSNFPPRWGYEQGTSISEMFLAPWTYEYFTLNRKAGYLYVNYANVGKHLAEIAFSGDYEIKEGQYIPQQSARPSFMCWLGDDIML